jgi:hypothetical protein
MMFKPRAEESKPNGEATQTWSDTDESNLMVLRARDEERVEGLGQPSSWRNFGRRPQGIRHDIRG